MASELSSLISRLKTYQPIGLTARPNALNFILNYQRFISTLENINNMVGLEKIKKQIAHQVESFIVNYRLHGKPTDKQRLHTMLCGPPGCGKTQIGEYLAELWASSGCLPSTEQKNDQRLFHHQPDINVNNQTLTTKLNLQTNSSQQDAEKISLRQNLAIQSAQIRQYQQKIQTTITTINNSLTQLNNVRKKVKSKSPDQEEKIQAKFQVIKKSLRDITGGAITSNHESSKSNSLQDISKPSSPLDKTAPEILPVTLPKIPGIRSMFGNSYVPILPMDSNNILSQLPSVNKTEISSEPQKPLAKFTRITRGDLVGKFQGHTTDKVRQILLEHVGGVIMIDEAYNLGTSGQDDFGKEILTEIINFMTTWPDKIIFIFAGYRKELEESILKIQPGLERRFNWNFEIEGYSSDELNLIFQQQLKNRFSGNLPFSEETLGQLDDFFKENSSKFPYYGGDTERFCDSVRETFNQQNWLIALDDDISQEEYRKLFLNIKFECFQVAFEKYLENSIKEKENKKKKEKEQLDRQKIQTYIW